jgi:hypothetical protein
VSVRPARLKGTRCARRQVARKPASRAGNALPARPPAPLPLWVPVRAASLVCGYSAAVPEPPVGNQSGFKIRKAGAVEVIEALIQRHAPLRNASEVAWALWAAIVLEIDLSERCAKAVASMEDDFVALLALDANERGRFTAGHLDQSGWEALIDYDTVLTGDHWLLAYEATIKGWLTSAATRVAASPFFSLLQQRDVYFYDRAPVHAPFTCPAGPLPGAPLPESYF